MRRIVIRMGGLALLGYAGVVCYLAYNETAFIYAGAGAATFRRAVPNSTVDFPWDTFRVAATDSVPVFMLRSRLDESPSRPWAIYLHGNYGVLGSRSNVLRYGLLRDAGFNVLAVEYRGYGASVGAGTPSEGGLNADASAAWTYLTRTLRVPPGRIAIYGWSLGGGPAMYLASQNRAAALITEGTFTTLPDVGAELYPWVPVRYIMRNRFDNVSRARSLEMPWIIFHGRRDSRIPFDHAERLLAAAPASRTRLVPLTAEHDDAVVIDRARALETLRELERAIRTP